MTELAAENVQEVNWAGRAVVLAAFSLFPSMLYFGFFELGSNHLSRLPAYLLEFIGVLLSLFLAFITLRHYNNKEAIGLNLSKIFSLRPYKQAWTALAIFGAADLAVTALILTLLMKYFPDSSGGEAIVKMWDSHRNWFFVFVSTIIFASCEEIVFRGLVFSYVKKHAGGLKALLVSSLIFSLMHVGTPWLSLVLFFINGMIYALAFEKTRGLAVPCLLHGLHNSALRCIGLLGLFQ